MEGNCYNGNGKRIWKDDGYEEGAWRNGRLNGIGKQFFGTTSDYAGDTYSGEFKEDKYDGKGTYRDVSTKSTYIGDFKNGKSNGFGILTFDSSSKFPNQVYKGEWETGKRKVTEQNFLGQKGNIEMINMLGTGKMIKWTV